MQFWLGVENFAKIEYAKICINEYTLLVGQNNSGKTFLMQLVQGMSKKLAELVSDDIIDIFAEEKSDMYCKCTVSKDNIALLVEYLNRKLYMEKESIVKEVFRKEIPVGELFVDIVWEDRVSYELYEFITDANTTMDYVQKRIGMNLPKFVSDFVPERKVCFLIKKQEEKKQLLAMSQSMSTSHSNLILGEFRSLFECKSLFMPASRTGLLLLYREFFANKADDTVVYTTKGGQFIRGDWNQGGFTQPVYEFLRFLQTYSEDEYYKEIFADELDFFEKNLIEGHISVNKQGMFSYDQNKTEQGIPMYLASSMINEIAPIFLAVTSNRDYRRFIIDEAEASLHPEKQLELVRFLNRLNNKGISIMVSTHSDTFASKLNNLYLLAEYVKESKEDIIAKFGLEKADLPDPQKLFVYEFTIQPNGKSLVKEVFRNEKTGYQFDLFTESALQLYEEAMKLVEISDDKC